MMLQSCTHEKALRELVERGQWPLAAPPDLRAHVEACCTCSDLVLVAGAFRQARADALPAVLLASPGILIWRAQLRRRNAAIERLTRPLIGAQLFALAVVLAACAGFLVFEARRGAGWLGSLSQGGFHLGTLLSSGSASIWMVLFFAFATLALAGGLAVYLTADRR